MFNDLEKKACLTLISLALDEDLGQVGDLTSLAVIPVGLQGQAVLAARSPGVLAGLPAVKLVIQAVDKEIQFETLQQDGTRLEKGDRLARVQGPMRGILAMERLSLNFVQRLSGIATLTRKFVDAVAGLPCKILDTRKTTPGWRVLEKYAVRCGGGHNHRQGLYDGILIKDNHLAALGAEAKTETLRRAIELARSSFAASTSTIPVEIEVDTLEQLDQALKCHPDIVLLDNMGPEHLREAVRRRNQFAPQVLLEASGGVTLETVRAIAQSGIDRISVGALTHSAPALDIALDYLF